MRTVVKMASVIADVDEATVGATLVKDAQALIWPVTAEGGKGSAPSLFFATPGRTSRQESRQSVNPREAAVGVAP